MKKPTKKEILLVQMMLGISLALGVLPPLVMFFSYRKKNIFYREASRKALNFHLTLIPLFISSSFLPPWVKYVILAIETMIILFAMICIAMQKPYQYPAIQYIKNKKIAAKGA
ncbi:DUF4870 domain-containing protein [Bacillus halotolerans]|uniref:DUF4870 domain-containing protein n=1 Tax=Bacillus halotolerans TaxID=260554 RepID=UPI000D011B57|nr:DUF4870 domain-containing protein [Bacillus halotolerans]PRP50986.1 DUF4870 domain-containing protein [Bacillus halotolerans]PRP59373.1 DUF4870 domain-containing protein [Bacillus halotolerans]PRP64038.1 DUF4870 domain-containing protein [Bacillus halotolerans]